MTINAVWRVFVGGPRDGESWFLPEDRWVIEALGPSRSGDRSGPFSIGDKYQYNLVHAAGMNGDTPIDFAFLLLDGLTAPEGDELLRVMVRVAEEDAYREEVRRDREHWDAKEVLIGLSDHGDNDDDIDDACGTFSIEFDKTRPQGQPFIFMRCESVSPNRATLAKIHEELGKWLRATESAERN